jgi:hypothetical protein
VPLHLEQGIHLRPRGVVEMPSPVVPRRSRCGAGYDGKATDVCRRRP